MNLKIKMKKFLIKIDLLRYLLYIYILLLSGKKNYRANCQFFLLLKRVYMEYNIYL